MMSLTKVFAFLISTYSAASSASLIDMSYVFDENVPTYPNVTKFQLKNVIKQRDEFGQWLEWNDFSTSEHVGTHIDAPVHFAQNSWTIDKIPLERLFRVPGVVIDVREQAKTKKNYGVTQKDIEKWEAEQGAIPDGAVVIFRTGWGLKAKTNSDAYSGRENETGRLNFPGLEPLTAEWLINHKKKHGYSKGVVGVGIDTLSIDVGSAFIYEVHAILMEKNIFVVENLKNVHLLPPKGFLLTALPMKIGGGSGGAARVVAEVGHYDAPVSVSPSFRNYLPGILLSLLSVTLMT